jgi:hypothetical protein
MLFNVPFFSLSLSVCLVISHYSITCSTIDKAHLRLAAAKAVLRLSRQWDHKVPVDVFYLTLRISQVCVVHNTA